MRSEDVSSLVEDCYEDFLRRVSRTMIKVAWILVDKEKPIAERLELSREHYKGFLSLVDRVEVMVGVLNSYSTWLDQDEERSNPQCGYSFECSYCGEPLTEDNACLLGDPSAIYCQGCFAAIEEDRSSRREDESEQ